MLSGRIIFRLVLVFSIAFSLAALTGPISSTFQLPTLRLSRAAPLCVQINCGACQTVGVSGACSDFWYPAGPAMNTLTATIFTDETAEYTNLQSSSPTIDLTDWPCNGTPTSGVCGTLTSSPNFLVTSPVAEVGYYEIEFHLANNYWNCAFNFGNSQCGIEIRQAIAHMWDRSQFCNNSVIAGICTPLDVPVPTTSGGGLPAPNPCAYDARFLQTGTSCVVGAPGGTAYHLRSSIGANGFAWLQAPGSVDLNASAAHLVAAGVATGFNGKTSILTSPVTTNTPTFFIRSDNAPRKQLGESLASQICYMFTGSYTQACSPFLNTVEGPLPAICPQGGLGPGPCCNSSSFCASWWMYTAAFSGPTFFDGSLYYAYNSRFVSGIPSIQQPNGPCSPQSVPSASAADYMYLCSPTYDSLTSQMEFAPCLSAPGDPSPGSVNNGPGANCPNTSHLSAISAGIQAEATFGAGEFTIPNFELTVQYGYLNNGWNRVINSATTGLPQSFTWLNAWNPSPPAAGTIRQGFRETTRSTNPYIGSTFWDAIIDGSIYDSLLVENPLNPLQLIDWMAYRVVQQSNSTVIAQNGYNPPPGTAATYHATLRNDVFFQDSRPVTSYDVAFSYLSMVSTGAFFGTGATGLTGVTVLDSRHVDIGVSSVGLFTLPNLFTIYIVPGRYWTGAGSSAWDSALASCNGTVPCAKAQYAISGSTVTCPSGAHPGCASFLASNMQIDPSKTTATYDPLANGTLIGSGPFECKSSAGVIGTGCSSTGAQNPPQPGGSYTLTRFGAGLAPASSPSGIYFRSSGDLALYDWSQENDIAPIFPVSAVAVCFGQPVNPSGSCVHWQNGIGASSTGVVGINQLSAVELRYNLNWIAPFEAATNPPLGMGAINPILYEGSTTLSPCSSTNPTGYDC